MNDQKKYQLILIVVVVGMVISLITVFTILLKSIEKVDQKINNKPEINITILNGFYGNPYK